MPQTFYQLGHRYLEDKLWQVLVDSFIAILDDKTMTAADIRDALKLAEQQLKPPRRKPHPTPVGVTP